MRVAQALRRRRWVLLGVALLCSALVALPLVGLLRIEDATDESHQYVGLVSTIDELTNGLLSLTTGALAQYGTTRDEADRERAAGALARAQERVGQIESLAGLQARLEIGETVTAHLDIAREHIAASERFLAEVDAGADVGSAESTDDVVEAAGQLLENQEALMVALAPASQALDDDRRSALRNAQYLLGAAALVALGTLGTLVVLDSRRVEQAFASETGRREHAERLAAHRADVVSMASHELRNPLTVLTMATDMLNRAALERDDADYAELANDARLAAVRCDMLVNELLDLGRLDAERLQLRIGSTPLLPAIREAVEVTESQHGRRNVVLTGEVGTQVSADPQRLRIILRNLIDNACKYSPEESEIVVRVESGNERIRVDVVDGGQGIPESDRERIFERFERVQSTAHIPGVGIGLFLSRELARRMNGDLRCVNAERGSDFCLELPAAT